MKTHHLALPVYQTGRLPLLLRKPKGIGARPPELHCRDSRLLGPYPNKAWVPEKASQAHES